MLVPLGPEDLRVRTVNLEMRVKWVKLALQDYKEFRANQVEYTFFQSFKARLHIPFTHSLTAVRFPKKLR